MNILITGSTGLIGSALFSALTASGHRITRLVRRRDQHSTDFALWDPAQGPPDPATLANADAVIHLAGENISSHRWSPQQKARIRDSRVTSTTLLAAALATLERPPRVFICASAVGYYGNRGDEQLSENSGPGTSFLADVCQAWEGATTPATERGIRVVNTRFGVVLSGNGGALPRMLTPFRFGLGGTVGNGRQFMSWISLDDAVAAIIHALVTDSLRGPVNVVAPNPAANAEFTQTLASILSRPAFLALPAFAVRFLLGEMGEELLLSSARVLPHKLLDSGFVFRYPLLKDALRAALRR